MQCSTSFSAPISLISLFLHIALVIVNEKTTEIASLKRKIIQIFYTI